MLILQRKADQEILFSNGIKIKILGTKKRKVYIGIAAPKNISIWRPECQQKKNSNDIIKEPIGQDESARDGTLSKEGSV